MDSTHLQTGAVVKTTSIWAHHDGPAKLRVSWKCKKGYRFVFVLLGTEAIDKPLDPEKALLDIGWEKRKE